MSNNLLKNLLYSAHAPLNMRQRLYLVLTASAAALSLGIYSPADFFIWHNTLYGLITVVLGALYLLLFLLARQRNLYLYAISCLALVPLDILWPFVEGGTAGTAELLFFVPTLACAVFLRGNIRWFGIALYILLGEAAYALQNFRPDLIRPFPSDTVGILHHSTAFLFGQIAGALAFWAIVSAYEREHRRVNEANQALTKALEEIKILRGLILMCAWCRRTLDDDGSWISVEDYISRHSSAGFTHGICPACREQQLSEDSIEGA